MCQHYLLVLFDDEHPVVRTLRTFLKSERQSHLFMMMSNSRGDVDARGLLDFVLRLLS